MDIDISKLRKCDVLAALYNNSQPLGMGFLHFTPEDMTAEQAQELIDDNGDHPLYFDYLKGRVMKIDLSNDSLVDTRMYDRDNGNGAGARVIADLQSE